jgi:hypothetical protein
MLANNFGNLFRNVYVASEPRRKHRSEEWGQKLSQPFERLARSLRDASPPEPFYPPEEGDSGPLPDIRDSLQEMTLEIRSLVQALALGQETKLADSQPQLGGQSPIPVPPCSTLPAVGLPSPEG